MTEKERIKAYSQQIKNANAYALKLSNPQLTKVSMVAVMVEEALQLLKSECDKPVETLVKMIQLTMGDDDVSIQ